MPSIASGHVSPARYKVPKIHCNAQMTPRFIKKYCELDASGNRMLELVTARLDLLDRIVVPPQNCA